MATKQAVYLAPTHCYVGTMPCGCNVAAVVDEPQHAKDTAAAIGSFVMSGYTVTRLALTDLHDGVVKLTRCVHRETGPKTDGSEAREATE